MAAVNVQKFGKELEKELGKTGDVETSVTGAAEKATPKKPKKKDRASLIKMIGEKLAKLGTDTKMAYHGKKYYAAKTGKDPEKVEREAAKKAKPIKKPEETSRTKTIKDQMKSYGVDWEKDKPSAKR